MRNNDSYLSQASFWGCMAGLSSKTQLNASLRGACETNFVSVANVFDKDAVQLPSIFEHATPSCRQGCRNCRWCTRVTCCCRTFAHTGLPHRRSLTTNIACLVQFEMYTHRSRGASFQLRICSARICCTASIDLWTIDTVLPAITHACIVLLPHVCPCRACFWKIWACCSTRPSFGGKLEVFLSKRYTAALGMGRS